MGIKYHDAPDIKDITMKIAKHTGIDHDFSRIVFMRSTGSKARGTIARCHALPKVMQLALDKKAHYVIEVISEKFDALDEEDKNVVQFEMAIKLLF